MTAASLPAAATEALPDTVDLVCVGGGLGGLAAAIRAHDLGLRVLVLEASDRLGGVGAYSGGIVWAPGNHLMPETERGPDLAAGRDYLAHIGGIGLDHDENLRETLLSRAGEVVGYLAKHARVDVRVAGVPDQFIGVVGSASEGARTLEVAAAGVDLGEWAAVLRDGPYFPDRLLASEVVTHRSADAARAAIGEEEVRRRRNIDFLARGRGLAGALLAAVVERGVHPRLCQRVRRLIVEDGAVTGIEVDGVDGPVQVRSSHGVLIATGSYGYASWCAQMEGLPEVHDQGPPITHGDGVSLTDPTPAALVRAGHGFTVLGYASPVRCHAGTDRPLHVPLWDSLGYPHSIVVNRQGERFGDESLYTTFTGAINRYDTATKQYPNHPAFLVVDDQFRKNGYVLGDDSHPWPESAMVRGDSLIELAEQLGVDAEGLEQTVAAYNRDVPTGVDTAFGRGATRTARERHGDPSYPHPNLGVVQRPPYWGLPVSILAAGIYSHGLWISPDAQVLDRSGHPVPGLFATGNAVAFTELPGGYENGIANARNLAYAFAAAEFAASQRPIPS